MLRVAFATAEPKKDISAAIASLQRVVAAKQFLHQEDSEWDAVAWTSTDSEELLQAVSDVAASLDPVLTLDSNVAAAKAVKAAAEDGTPWLEQLAGLAVAVKASWETLPKQQKQADHTPLLLVCDLGLMMVRLYAHAAACVAGPGATQRLTEDVLRQLCSRSVQLLLQESLAGRSCAGAAAEITMLLQGLTQSLSRGWSLAFRSKCQTLKCQTLKSTPGIVDRQKYTTILKQYKTNHEDMEKGTKQSGSAWLLGLDSTVPHLPAWQLPEQLSLWGLDNASTLGTVQLYQHVLCCQMLVVVLCCQMLVNTWQLHRRVQSAAVLLAGHLLIFRWHEQPDAAPDLDAVMLRKLVTPATTEPCGGPCSNANDSCNSNSSSAPRLLSADYVPAAHRAWSSSFTLPLIPSPAHWRGAQEVLIGWNNSCYRAQQLGQPVHISPGEGTCS